jgi:hypothetical protein
MRRRMKGESRWHSRMSGQWLLDQTAEQAEAPTDAKGETPPTAKTPRAARTLA